MRWTRTVVGAGLAILLLVVAEQRFSASRLTTKVTALEQEQTRLKGFIERLSASRRVAQVRVTRQSTDEAGAVVSLLEWQEFTPNGLVTPPVQVQVVGKLVYFEAWVIKFNHEHVAKGDPDRGASVALFRRIFGERQAPESAPMLHELAGGDTPGPVAAAERILWTRFWEFVDQPHTASRLGIRVAQCEAPAVPAETGDVWEVALDAAGGLNVRKMSAAATIAGVSPPTP